MLWDVCGFAGEGEDVYDFSFVTGGLGGDLIGTTHGEADLKGD
jgi:hypothetical protein